MDNIVYFKLRKMLNKEQKAITKGIIMKKLKNIKTPLPFLLIRESVTRKIFTATTIYQALILIYKKCIDNDQDKQKGLITTYMRKEKIRYRWNYITFNISRTFQQI